METADVKTPNQLDQATAAVQQKVEASSAQVKNQRGHNHRLLPSTYCLLPFFAENMFRSRGNG